MSNTQKKRSAYTDTKKFRAAMILNGFVYKTLAKEVGISPATLCNKVNNKGNSEFTASEISLLAEKLKIDNIQEYFLTNNIN